MLGNVPSVWHDTGIVYNYDYLSQTAPRDCTRIGFQNAQFKGLFTRSRCVILSGKGAAHSSKDLSSAPDPYKIEIPRQNAVLDETSQFPPFPRLRL